MNKLYIDTRNNNDIVVRLEKNEDKFQEKSAAVENHAQTILPLIQKVLSDGKTKLVDVSEIKVETGPGSFTGIRVGVAIANALSFSGLVTVNGKEIGEIVEAKY